MVLLGVAGSARAADDQPAGQSATQPAAQLAPEALRHLGEGNRLYREGSYAEAVREYREAFALVPSGKLHFNIGLAEKMLGNAVVAARELDLFREDPGDADGNVRAHADAYLADLTTVVATIQLRLAQAPMASVVLIDDVDLPASRAGRPIRLSPGYHRVVVRAPGAAAWSRAIDLAPGAEVQITPRLDLNATPPAGRNDGRLVSSPVSTPSPGDGAGSESAPLTRRWWLWATVASVAGVGVTAAFLIHGRGNDPCEGRTNCIPLMPDTKP